MWDISKEFSFCYGHRVYSQVVDPKYTHNNSSACKCRHLHGHEGLVKVHLDSGSLKNGMVADFLHLGWLKNFVDNELDHKFIIDKNDPMFASMVHQLYMDNILPTVYLGGMSTVDITVNNVLIGNALDMRYIVKDTPAYEILDGFFIVDFVPTSENLAKWMHDLVSIKMRGLGVNVAMVEWHETPKSCARYSKPISEKYIRGPMGC